MRRAALTAIRAYQRYLSPHKGFCCAYRHHTGRPSCSSFGYRAISRYGVIVGMGLVKRRTHLCGVIHQQSLITSQTFHKQRGHCDPGCDPNCDTSFINGCDVPSHSCPCDPKDFEGLCTSLQAASECCNSCNGWSFPNRQRKNHKNVQANAISIPPKIKVNADPLSQQGPPDKS